MNLTMSGHCVLQMLLGVASNSLTALCSDTTTVSTAENKVRTNIVNQKVLKKHHETSSFKYSV